MPSTRSGASYNPSSSSRKGYGRDYGRSQSVTEGKESVNGPKLINYAILNLRMLFKLQAALTLLQEASVDIYKASQKAYNNALQHKEYQILEDMWKNCMNSYLTVRTFLGNPSTFKLCNGWGPLMEKKNIILLTAEWRENNPPPPKQVPKTAPVASSSNSNVKNLPQAQKKGKGKAPATKTYRQGYRIPNIQQDAMENVFHMDRKIMELQKKEESRLKYQN
ncbi:hypothetical protein O181_006595 [Austropuccinia psidii MF-1]|uniref:No apical meristem-associated C-terminal domain-containing protein n=1 Tax=Austropuccinia psidii MF-1 TaxID=1389203 RepID=A0A9Q3BKQ6_9BASI|nr:hypothetical protein [Austropuccinia psidii MF-1]